MPTYDPATSPARLIVSQRLLDILLDARPYSTIAQIIYDYREQPVYYDARYLVTDKLNYLDYREGMLTYLPAGRPHLVDDDGEWVRQNRQVGKPGRVIRRVLARPDNYDDSDYEQFAALLTASDLGETGAFEVVREGAIIDVYEACEDVGHGLSSCMTHATDYLTLYAANPDRIGLLIARTVDDELVGRGLVWILDDGSTILDRVYGGIVASRAMRDHAIGQGWTTRDHDKWHTWEWRSASGQPVADASFVVTLDHHRHESYPYMDTMIHYYPARGVIAAASQSGMGHAHTLASTGGAPWNAWQCCNCSRSLLDDDDDVCFEGLRPYCAACHAQSFQPCAGCGAALRGRDGYELGVTRRRYCYPCYVTRVAFCHGCDAITQRRQLRGGYCADCRQRRVTLTTSGNATFTVEGATHVRS